MRYQPMRLDRLHMGVRRLPELSSMRGIASYDVLGATERRSPISSKWNSGCTSVHGSRGSIRGRLRTKLRPEHLRSGHVGGRGSSGDLDLKEMTKEI